MRFESSGAIRVQLVFAICDFATGAKTVSHQWSKKFIFTSLALFSVFASTARSDELNRFDGLPAWGSVLKAWEACPGYSPEYAARDLSELVPVSVGGLPPKDHSTDGRGMVQDSSLTLMSRFK